jgi:tetratricopeptide repeat protein
LACSPIDERGARSLGGSLVTLAALAGRTVVDAAAADEWETAQRRFARILGRGDAEQTRLVELHLKETHEKLIGAVEKDVGLVRTALGVGWTAWLLNFLEENPGTEADLQTLVQEIQSVLPDETVSTSHGAVSASGAVSTDAAQGPGPEHPGALAARSELAYSTGLAGDAASARDQFAALLPIAERTLGPEHPDTLTNRHNIANFAGYAGDAGAARDQFAALLPASKRVFGPDHPDTLAARFNLAYWTGRAGDAAAARDQFAVLLLIRERVSGPDHHDTLAAREELAYWTGRTGDATAARDQFAALLPIRERVCGPEHAKTLAIWYQLAHWTALARDAPTGQD